ncbi:hypothetical protein I8H84_00900 [Candidatus Saccharibacteria bacterium]|nr:hypothetical protein [Candidatus Saccharibacteria bacterium]MBH1972505.1 hypothetical protein [Candidatus Saccharibacteria bacterium]MBH1990153.1 hypothetical protein [Candidatus Saccharibacteria bacterium]
MRPYTKFENPVALHRNEHTVNKTVETLSDKNYTLSNYAVTLDTATAQSIGDAITRRDINGVTRPFKDTLNAISREFSEADLSESREAIETALQERLPSSPSSLLDTLTDTNSRNELYNAMLETNDQTEDNIGLTRAEYMRLLETIVIAETPDSIDLSNKYRDNPGKYRDKKASLYSRALTTLDIFATNEPGLRPVREGMLEENSSALAEFLQRESSRRVAQDILSDHFDSIQQGTALSKKAELRYLIDEDEQQGDIEKFQILEWTMLPGDEESRESTRASIRRSVKANLKKQSLEDWDESRVDLLFEVADIGHKNGRQPEVYISNTFKSNAGVYLAVSLTHPQDPNKRIVLADNPLYGNAIYFVDEMLTERNPSTDTPYNWREVMVESKQEARRRGASRRVHVGEWEDFAYKICSYEGKPKEEAPTTFETPISPCEYEYQSEHKADSNTEMSDADRAIARADTALRVARELLTRLSS